MNCQFCVYLYADISKFSYCRRFPKFEGIKFPAFHWCGEFKFNLTLADKKEGSNDRD